MSTEINHNGTDVTDRIALSRAQHLKSRTNRPRSISDDETDAISDWSESDLECSPVSDIDSTSNNDEITDYHYHNIPFDDDGGPIDERLPREPILLENILRLNETPLPVINGSPTNSRTSFSCEVGKPKQQEQQQSSNVNIEKSPIQTRKQLQTPLLPARRIQSKQVSPRQSTANSHVLPQTPNLSYNRKTITANSSRLYLRRGTTSTNISSNTQSTKESTLSSSSSLHSNDDNHSHQRHISTSPISSQTSTSHGVLSRIYEVKKVYVDGYDYGRLSDVSAVKTIPPRSRQKWGTIVHPPFPLGYQQITSEQLTHAVERLASPVRCRDRHTPVQSSSKRYLSVEETEALINRLTKVKPIRSTDQYWPIQHQSRPVKNISNALKTNNNWKGVGISA
ncbi:unnamed protein product [Adineta steineri]|uniref:Uncharacterized protein n=1 Tax=Adineta steineri TaxID=433720 RepID=A0A814I6X6_9BILA|nr:unnamed protein product [Adineta steineri]CAF1018933.1 unnamed protein product [Adineta steineri]